MCLTDMKVLIALCFLIASGLCQDNVVKLLVLLQEGQNELMDTVSETLKSTTGQVKFDFSPVWVKMDDNSSISEDEICKHMETGHSIALDLTWGNLYWRTLQERFKIANLPYFKVDLTVGVALRMLESYLKLRNATDIALIFESMEAINEALVYMVDKSTLRTVILNGLDEISASRLKKIRPMPSFYIIISYTQNMMNYIKKAQDNNLIQLPERWNLLFLDFDNHGAITATLMDQPISLLSYSKNFCCSLQGIDDCMSCPSATEIKNIFIKSFINFLTKIIADLTKEGSDITMNSFKCGTSNDFPTRRYLELIRAEKQNLFSVDANNVYSPQVSGIVETNGQKIATYSDKNKLKLEPGAVINPTKKYLRIGTTFALPWTYQETDPLTKTTEWTGYCIDFINMLSKRMNFDYELVIPKVGTFGKIDADGDWDGIVGDLIKGETDIAVSALTMTADREEVIDFVAPYFEQTGISIVMRKPVRKTSLFRFMTVLKLEVWLSIVGALVITGFMIWFLDKYSPYSAKNNGKAYPYPCRDFTLKESFWFALTSFTPQGGGEAPKALSGRTLVAAYWLFVVLMLATFTANLAAFLTVERMQSPVQSLEQLAKQSRINYTVVMESTTHQYFINMKFAEDTLYRLWKELTLNASTHETQYRVWDYPVKEQYGHILLAINDSMPVMNASLGFQKVVEHTDADFAFIHDSSEIKYEMSKNCNLTEVGEVFAERPYAVAVQQGSHLQEDIAREILELQKLRFFEGLKAKYWNNSIKGVCFDADDSEGITLESLGGVFIATLFGLALAMITLLGEVLFYRRKKARKVQELKYPKGEMFGKIDPKHITIGPSFKPVAHDKNTKPSIISVYPRNPIHPRSEYNTFLN